LKIAIAGATGLVGSRLVPYWGNLGHGVNRLVRSPEGADATDIFWKPMEGGIAPSSLEGFDAVVVLSGAGIADARWTGKRKELLRESRTKSVGLIARTLAACDDKPQCLVCASAVGYYGLDRGEEVLTEESASGDDFIADLCKDWEDAATPAVDAGIRVVNARFGIILSSEGGALKKMLTPFSLGLGGPLGSGKQYMSWVSIDDAIGAIDFAIQHDDLVGPVNVVAPEPARNRDFVKTLGTVLRRPAIAKVPAFVLRTALGDMAEMLLGSVRAYPRRLESAGYGFRHANLEAALREQLEA